MEDSRAPCTGTEPRHHVADIPVLHALGQDLHFSRLLSGTMKAADGTGTSVRQGRQDSITEGRSISSGNLESAERHVHGQSRPRQSIPTACSDLAIVGTDTSAMPSESTAAVVSTSTHPAADTPVKNGSLMHLEVLASTAESQAQPTDTPTIEEQAPSRPVATGTEEASTTSTRASAPQGLPQPEDTHHSPNLDTEGPRHE